MRRVKQLELARYIKVVDYIGNGERVYCITKRGCKFLDVEYTPILKNDKLNHYLACADFFFSVKDKGVKNILFEEQYYYTHKGRKYSFRPDLIVLISESGKNKWYFVEIDLSCRRFIKKIKEWEGYYNSGAFKSKYKKYPPILIVSTQVDKVKEIMGKYSKVGLNYIYRDFDEVKNWDFRY